VNNRIENTGISQQLALVTSGFCLLVSLALVTLGAISSRHMQAQQQQEYGSALAHQIARPWRTVTCSAFPPHYSALWKPLPRNRSPSSM
jgi:hypothetical protein